MSEQTPVTKWPIEAEHLNIDALDYIYQTEDIKKFLRVPKSVKGEGTYFVCGLKGLGKTLVLTAKRKNYLKLPETEAKSYVMIPENQFLDVLGSFQPFEHIWDMLRNSVLWKDIWGLSIGLSIISFFLHTSGKIDVNRLEREINYLLTLHMEKDVKEKTFIDPLLLCTQKTKSNPSKFVTLIVNNLSRKIYDRKIIPQMFNSIFNVLNENIVSQCAIFIDHVDKSWEDFMLNYFGNPKEIHKLQVLQEIWYSCQIGLINSINDICTRNHHIRIYTAIRQEVLGKMEETDPNYLRKEEKMLILNYKKMELKNLFKKAIIKFENRENLVKPDKIEENEIEAFLGLKNVKPFRIKTTEKEDIFSYMYRHSIQRPRDICHIGCGISKKDPKERTEEEIKILINNLSKDNLTNDYLKDLERLMKIDLDMAYSLINKNILTLEELSTICSNYNEIINNEICNRDCAECDKTHLFCALYNIGLIGIIKWNALSEKRIQMFLDSGKRKLILTKPILPKSDVYLLHPTFCHKIEDYKVNRGMEFHLDDNIIVGHLREYPSNAKPEKLSDKDSSKDSFENPPGTSEDISKKHKEGRSITTKSESIMKCDYAIITALPEELDALKKYFNQWEEIKEEGSESIRTYHKTNFNSSDGREKTLVATCTLGKGRVPAALATADLIRDCNPSAIFLVGIAAGLHSQKQNLGDVVIADQIVDYEEQKLTGGEQQIRWSVYRSGANLLESIQSFRDTTWIEALSNKISLPSFLEYLNASVGTVLCGDKVVACKKVKDEISTIWVKAAAIEMESAGVAAAVYQKPNPPEFVMIKGISDFADEEKSDNDRKLAAQTAACFTYSFLTKTTYNLKKPIKEQSSYAESVPKQNQSNHVNRRKILRETISLTFDMEEAHTLTFDLGIEWDDLRGEAKSPKIRELVAYMERMNRFEELWQTIQTIRPGILEKAK